jgi:hypothetical protein
MFPVCAQSVPGYARDLTAFTSSVFLVFPVFPVTQKPYRGKGYMYVFSPVGYIYENPGNNWELGTNRNVRPEVFAR